MAAKRKIPCLVYTPSDESPSQTAVALNRGALCRRNVTQDDSAGTRYTMCPSLAVYYNICAYPEMCELRDDGITQRLVEAKNPESCADWCVRFHCITGAREIVQSAQETIRIDVEWRADELMGERFEETTPIWIYRIITDTANGHFLNVTN